MALDLSSYIEAAGESSARARRILVVMLTFSVLLLCAYWNAYGGMHVRRLRLLDSAIAWHEARTAEAARANRANLSFDTAGSPEWKHLRQQYAVAGNTADSVLFKRVRNDRDELHKYLLVDGNSIGVPFVGLKVDVGDLWVFACIALTFLQVALLFATARETADVGLALAVAKKSGDREQWVCAYRLLSMRQLFTVPPKTHKRAGEAWKFAAKLLFVLPFGSQVFGVIVGSGYTADMLGVDPTAGLLESWSWEIVTILASLLLTIAALYQEWLFDKVWRRLSPFRKSSGQRRVAGRTTRRRRGQQYAADAPSEADVSPAPLNLNRSTPNEPSRR